MPGAFEPSSAGRAAVPIPGAGLAPDIRVPESPGRCLTSFRQINSCGVASVDNRTESVVIITNTAVIIYSLSFWQQVGATDLSGAGMLLCRILCTCGTLGAFGYR